MNKPRLPRFSVRLVTHWLIVAAGSFLLARTAAGTLTYLGTYHLDANQIERSMVTSMRPASASVRIGSRNTLTVQLDNQGQVPTKLSMLLTYPADLLAIGEISSPQTACRQTLRLVRQSGSITVECNLEQSQSKTQLSDVITLSYLPTAAGSGMIRMLSDQSQASGPAGNLILDSHDASLTITP